MRLSLLPAFTQHQINIRLIFGIGCELLDHSRRTTQHSSLLIRHDLLPFFLSVDPNVYCQHLSFFYHIKRHSILFAKSCDQLFVAFFITVFGKNAERYHFSLVIFAAQRLNDLSVTFPEFPLVVRLLKKFLQ